MNHQASREDFELEDAYKSLIGKTLEEVITKGEFDWEKKQARERISVLRLYKAKGDSWRRK